MASVPHPVPTFDTLSFVGLERSHLRNAVYRRVFGDDAGPVRIGRYSILERIGSGARGVVFKAFDNQLDRLVALKVLSTRAGDHAELIREAKALARLSHPNVLSVYEVGETEEAQVFLATEYVKGWTLRGWFDEEHRSEAAIVEVMRQVALGVQAAHDEGLVHRDLKPANILVGNDGRVRVADFGLARFDPTALEPGTPLARDGFATTTAGTPGYMAPELFEGKPASSASDQYALAVTLHELLRGDLPSESSVRSSVRGPIASALQRGLAAAPEDRFPSVRAFADALTARSGRSKRRLVGLGAALVGLGSVSAALLLLPPGTADERDPELALLKARAALPHDPAAALDALREVADVEDDRALAIAEEALALGPEDARWTLPEGARAAEIFGDLLFYYDADDTLVARGLSRTAASRVELASLGIEPLDFGPNFYVTEPSFQALNAAAMMDAYPIATRSYDQRKRDIGTSEDGSRIIRIGEDDRSVVVEHSRTRDVLWAHDNGEVSVSSVSMDQGGRRIAWTDAEGAAFVHDIETDTSYPIGPAAAEVWFEPGDESVVVRGKNAGVFQVRLSDGRVTPLFDEDARFSHVELSPSGEWIAAKKAGGKIEVGGGKSWTTRTFEGDDFVFSPSGSRLATYDGEEFVVHDLVTGDRQTVVARKGVEQVEFATDGELWVVGTDKVLRHHTVDLGIALVGHTATIYDIALSKDGRRAVSVAHDYTVRLWDVETGEGRVLGDVDWEPHDVALNDHRREVAVSGPRNNGSLFDFDGRLLGSLPPTSGRARVTENGDWMGAGSEGIWRRHDGETTVLFAESCSGLFVDGSTYAALCDGTSELHVWSEGEHYESEIAPGYGQTLHAWPNSEQLLLMSNRPTWFTPRGGGRLDSAPAPRSLMTGDTLPLPSVSSAAHDLIVSQRDGVFVIWDANTEPFRLATSSSALAITDDGSRYALSGDRNQIIVRDRPLSKGKRDLASVLEAHTVVEGQL